MKIKFLGASGTVTGSSYALTSSKGQSILIDFGMFQGPKAIDDLNYEQFEFNCHNLSHILLTHAHLDHSGRLPLALKLGFRGSIWLTPATQDLLELTLFDSAKIASKNPQALYDELLVEKTLTHTTVVNYKHPTTLGDFQVTYHDAGHLLGSAFLEIQDTSSSEKIIFSGDIGNYPQALLQETHRPPVADFAVLESTYGDRLHPKTDPLQDLQTEINAVEESSGTLLIPSFAMQKTQELLYLIMKLKSQNRISSGLPVYLDSPMAQKATQIYTSHTPLLDPHLQKEFKTKNAFHFPGLEIIANHQKSQNLHQDSQAKVIIAGGGMMTGGRILSHAVRFLPEPQNRLYFVGYQGEETLGREILEGAKQVTINHLPIDIKATISSTQSMSSHADQQQLIDWLSAIKGVKKVFLTHGENPSRATLAQKISLDLAINDLVLPFLNQEIDF